MKWLRCVMSGALAASLMLAGAVYSDSVPQAHATVAVAHPLSELVALADRVVVARALEKRSQWEDVGGKRIVTYTKVQIDQGVFGSGQTTLWVRTLGGVVGKVGQHVEGQARLRIGEQALLFLSRADKTFVVSGAAQGHYPVRVVKQDDSERRVLAASPSRGKVMRRPGPSLSAADVLVGVELDKGIERIRTEKRSQDARKK